MNTLLNKLYQFETEPDRAPSCYVTFGIINTICNFGIEALKLLVVKHMNRIATILRQKEVSLKGMTLSSSFLTRSSEELFVSIYLV